MTIALPLLPNAFADFDIATLPPMGEGWQDVSYGNDCCPSFWHPGARVLVQIDYADVSLREFADGHRFYLNEVDEEGQFPLDAQPPILATDNWDEVVRLVASRLPDMDAAGRMVQDAMGVTTGDVAGLYFSGNEPTTGKDWHEAWPLLSQEARAEALRGYQRTEELYRA